MSLQPRQYELDGLKFGERTRYICGDPDVSEPDIRDNDVDMPRGDGFIPGRDRRGKRTLTFDLTVDAYTADDAQDYSETLEAAWLADDVRNTPGKWSVLRYRWGKGARRVYGRPRKIAGKYELYWQGRVDYTAEFETANHLSYADEEDSVHINTVPPGEGGLLVPAVAPFDLAGVGESRRGTFTVGGKVAAPLRIRVHGPIRDARLEFDVFTIELRGSIKSDDYVELDAFTRTAVSKFNHNWAGSFTRDTPVLTDMALKPGDHYVALYGHDQTGTASAAIYWRETFPTL